MEPRMQYFISVDKVPNNHQRLNNKNITVWAKVTQTVFKLHVSPASMIPNGRKSQPLNKEILEKMLKTKQRENKITTNSRENFSVWNSLDPGHPFSVLSFPLVENYTVPAAWFVYQLLKNATDVSTLALLWFKCELSPRGSGEHLVPRGWQFQGCKIFKI